MGPSARDVAPRVATPIRRPLLGIAVFYLAGTVVGLAGPGGGTAWLLAGAGCLALAGVDARRRGGWLVFAVLAVAAARAGQWAEPPGRPTLEHLMVRPAESIAVRGRILRDPEWHPDWGADGREEQTGQWRMLAAVQAVNRLGRFQPAGGRIACVWSPEAGEAHPRYGDTWEWYGVARRPTGPWAGLGGASAFFRVTDADPRRIATDGGHPWVQACLRAREACAEQLALGVTDFPDQVAVIKALLLGYRSGLPPAWEDRFARTGTLHVFAISGLHVGVMAMLVVGVLRVMGVPRHHWVLIVVPVLVLYTLGTGMKASAVRACVMALAYWSASLVKRKPDAPSALALAALVLAVAEPGQAVSIGFILSFAVVSGILLLAPILYRPMQTWLRADPWLAGPEPKWLRWGRAGADRVAALAALSLACWAVAFPLTAHYFHVVAPVGLVGNLLVVPGAFLIVLTGCLSLVGGLVSGFVAETFNHANRVFVSALLEVVVRMDGIPGGVRYVPAVGWGWVIGWYLLLVFWIRTPAGRRWPWGIGLLVLAVAWMGVYPVRPSLRCTALSGGGSGLLLVEAGTGPTLLVDTGSTRGARRVVRRLRALGVNRLDRLILTRCDEQRNGAAPAVLAAVEVGEILLNPIGADPDHRRVIQESAVVHGIPLSHLRPGHQGYLSDRTEWEVPAEGASPGEPTVLRFARDGLAVLWMNGGNRAAEYRFAQADIYPRAQVLIMADRDGAEPLYRGWLNSVNPELVVWSPPRYGVGSWGALVRSLSDAGIPVAGVDDDAGLVVKTKGTAGWETETVELVP